MFPGHFWTQLDFKEIFDFYQTVKTSQQYQKLAPYQQEFDANWKSSVVNFWLVVPLTTFETEEEEKGESDIFSFVLFHVCKQNLKQTLSCGLNCHVKHWQIAPYLFYK